jgi:hypothetical protein
MINMLRMKIRRLMFYIALIAIIMLVAKLYNQSRVYHQWEIYCDRMQESWATTAVGDAIPLSPEYPSGFGTIEEIHASADVLAHYFDGMRHKFHVASLRPWRSVRFGPLEPRLERLAGLGNIGSVRTDTPPPHIPDVP